MEPAQMATESVLMSSLDQRFGMLEMTGQLMIAVVLTEPL